MQVYSFPPISAPDATRLVLGSMPGKASLAAGQYYAHPRNHFWQVIETLFDLPAGSSYEARCAVLVEHRIALWDVLKACFRTSSLDSDIVEESIVPNDFAGFLARHPRIRAIYFNGAKAESVYLRYVRPTLPDALASIPLCRLPSTSPANASWTFRDKLERWRVITTAS